MEKLSSLVDYSNKLGAKFRKKRFKLFEKFMEDVKDFHKILDVGGTKGFWDNVEYSKINNSHITLLNLVKIPSNNDNFTSITGNATDMKEFNDKEFDVVFSNSVIEHLSSYENQKKMAQEIKRTGKKYFIQTPNKRFPIEPHFIFPFWPYLPKFVKIWILMNFKIGHLRKKSNNKTEAEKIIGEFRLLTKKELMQLFPEGNILEEKFLFFTKSYIVHS